MEKQPNLHSNSSEKVKESEQGFGIHPLAREEAGAALPPPPFELEDSSSEVGEGDASPLQMMERGDAGGGSGDPDDPDSGEGGGGRDSSGPDSDEEDRSEDEGPAPAATYTDPNSGLVFNELETGVFAERAYRVVERGGIRYIYFDLVHGYIPYDQARALMDKHAEMPGPSRARESREVRAAYMEGNIALRTAKVQPEAPKAPAKPPAVKKPVKPFKKKGMMTMTDLLRRDDKSGRNGASGINRHQTQVSNGDGTVTLQEMHTLKGSDSPEKEPSTAETEEAATEVLTLHLTAAEEEGGETVVEDKGKEEAGETVPEEAATKEEEGPDEAQLSTVLGLSPAGAAPAEPIVADPFNPDMGQLVQAYAEGMANENLWGDEAAATVLANQMGVQFIIHQFNDAGVEINTIQVGAGGNVLHLRHQGRHFTAVNEHGQLIADVPANGDCLFYAAYYAVHRVLPLPEEVRELRRLVASRLTLIEIQNIVLLLLADAQAGHVVHGVGHTLRALLLPVTFEAIRRRLRAVQAPASEGHVVGGKLTLEEAREKMAASSTSLSEKETLIPKEEAAPAEKEEEALEDALEPSLSAEEDSAGPEEAARQVPNREMRPFVPGVLDEYAAARNEFEHNRTLLYAQEGAKNLEARRLKEEQQAKAKKPKPVVAKPAPVVEAAPLVVEAEEEIVEMEAGEIQAFVLAHPPEIGQTPYTYLEANTAHLPPGFLYYPHQMAVVTAAIEEFLEAEATAVQLRLQNFNAIDPSTWVMGPVQYLNGTEGIVEGTVGGAAILANLANGGLGGNTRGRGTTLVADQPLHTHLAGGSWGLAFAYVQDSTTGLVHPVIYDVAYGRLGNQYRWANGGTGYNSGADFR